MPCHDHRDSPSAVRAESESRIRELERRNDQLMRVICSIDEHFNLTDKQMMTMRHGQEVQQVILKHRADDAAEVARRRAARDRKRAEQQKAAEKAAVIATLTPAQKAALNLK